MHKHVSCYILHGGHASEAPLAAASSACPGQPSPARPARPARCTCCFLPGAAPSRNNVCQLIQRAFGLVAGSGNWRVHAGRCAAGLDLERAAACAPGTVRQWHCPAATQAAVSARSWAADSPAVPPDCLTRRPALGPPAGGYYPVLIGEQFKEGRYTVLHFLGQVRGLTPRCRPGLDPPQPPLLSCSRRRLGLPASRRCLRRRRALLCQAARGGVMHRERASRRRWKGGQGALRAARLPVLPLPCPAFCSAPRQPAARAGLSSMSSTPGCTAGQRCRPSAAAMCRHPDSGLWVTAVF